jgi:hypothetical protein
MTATDNLDGLLKALNGRNWFRMLPIIADAYADLDDWEAAEAIRWILENKKKPRRIDDGTRRWGWMHSGEDKNTIHADFDYEIAASNDGEMWTPTISPQLTGFIAAWKQGLRP